MLKGGDLHMQQSHIPTLVSASNPSGEGGNSLNHEVATPIIQNSSIAPLTNSNDGFSKV